MNPLWIVWFMIAVLPFYMFREGWAMFSKFMTHKNWWGQLPYFILTLLVFILLILFANGYRW